MQARSIRVGAGLVPALILAGAAWSQDLSTAPARVNLLLQTNFAAREETPVAFSVKRAEIALSGRASHALGYLVRLDPAATLFKDGLLSWEFTPFLTVTAGRFKFPQGLEGRTPSGKLHFVERTLLGASFGDKREIGVQVANFPGPLNGNNNGSSPQPEYAVAAVNDRTGAARVGLRQGLFFAGANALYGEPATGLRKRWGLEGRIETSSWTWQGEVGIGEDNGLQQGGGYAALARRIGCVRPSVRVEEWDPNRNAPNDKAWWLTAGADWFVLGDELHGSKVTVNGALGLEEGPAKSNNALLVQWQVVW